MKNFNLRKLFKYLALGLFLSLGLVTFSSAQKENKFESLEFPISELGNCTSVEECAFFCDQPENFKACLDFGERANLLSQEEVAKSRQLIEAAEKGGPGGCQGTKECDAYCDDISHLKECLEFAERESLLPPEEIEEGKKILKAMDQGLTPPGDCHNKTECDQYCDQPEHLEECLTFGVAAGLIDSEEAAIARKTGGKGPGGCWGKEECDEYCNEPEHMEECINFGLEHGLMTPEEAEEVKGALRAIKEGIAPPKCRGKEECEAYCSQPEHTEECVNFAVAAGFMTPEEAARAKEMAKAGIFAGPGGCKSREECEAYCEEPEHIKECTDFALKTGLMTPEEARRAEKIMQLEERPGPGGCRNPKECKAYCDDPAHVDECLGFAQETGIMKPEEVEMARKFSPMGPGGPGGCQGKEECEVYCSQPQNMEECISFSLKEGIIEPEEAVQMKKQVQGPPLEEEFPEMMQQPGLPPSQQIPSQMTPPEEMPWSEHKPSGEEGPYGPYEIGPYPEGPMPWSEEMPFPEQGYGEKPFYPSEEPGEHLPEEVMRHQEFIPPEPFPPQKLVPKEGSYPEGSIPPEQEAPPQEFAPRQESYPREFVPSEERYIPPEGFVPPEESSPPQEYAPLQESPYPYQEEAPFQPEPESQSFFAPLKKFLASLFFSLRGGW